MFIDLDRTKGSTYLKINVLYPLYDSTIGPD